ncbi:hypothetical protein N9P53_00305 [Flavobacteriaceae bacterium]|nr:hypothetical protein [Flavobacteriaceae bacterium]
MTQKEYKIAPNILLDICKSIYKFEEQKEDSSYNLTITISASINSWGEKISIKILPTDNENKSTLIYKSEKKYNWTENLDGEKEFFEKLEKQLKAHQS